MFVLDGYRRINAEDVVLERSEALRRHISSEQVAETISSGRNKVEKRPEIPEKPHEFDGRAI